MEMGGKALYLSSFLISPKGTGIVRCFSSVSRHKQKAMSTLRCGTHSQQKHFNYKHKGVFYCGRGKFFITKAPFKVI